MKWKKFTIVISIVLILGTASLAFFGVRWYWELAPIPVPDEYSNIDVTWPTYTSNSTLFINDTNVDTLLGHTGDGLSMETAYVFEGSLLTGFYDDQGRTTLSVYNVDNLIIRNSRFELASYSNTDGLPQGKPAFYLTSA